MLTKFDKHAATPIDNTIGFAQDWFDQVNIHGTWTLATKGLHRDRQDYSKNFTIMVYWKNKWIEVNAYNEDDLNNEMR